MFKFRLIVFVFVFLLTACSTNSNLAPVDSIHKVNNSDLENMHDCKNIQANIYESQEILNRYKKSKSLNTSANVLSGVASILSLGTSSVDYVSNDDINNGIKSYQDRLSMLETLQNRYCSH